MDDTQIIDLYWDRDQGAITATAGKYGSFLHALSWNILRSHHDAEECVNDTYFRAWNAIPPERPSALRAWLGRITRNLSLTAGRRGGPKAGARVWRRCWGNWTSASPTIGDRSRRRRSGFWRNVSARFCGDRRRITGISSCGAIGTARISPPSQSVWIAARAG